MGTSIQSRRDEILKLLNNSKNPIAAKDLASKFGVSRQVIVQDLAVIRASVPGIVSTNRGYVLQKDDICSREFKVHHDNSKVEQELNIIVDCGGHIKNVSISHRVYDRITANMDIRSRQDVKEFLDRLNNSKSTLLGNATCGYHYHLVEASNEERLDMIQRELEKAGILAPLLTWEQDD